MDRLEALASYIGEFFQHCWEALQMARDVLWSRAFDTFFDRTILWLIILSGLLAIAVMIKYTWQWDYLGWSILALFIVMFPVLYGYAYIRVDHPHFLGNFGRYFIRSLVFIALVNFDVALILSLPESDEERKARYVKYGILNRGAKDSLGETDVPTNR